jgi:hypothetical protein
VNNQASDSFEGDGQQRPCGAAGAVAALQPFGDGLRADGAPGVRECVAQLLQGAVPLPVAQFQAKRVRRGRAAGSCPWLCIGGHTLIYLRINFFQGKHGPAPF